MTKGQGPELHPQTGGEEMDKQSRGTTSGKRITATLVCGAVNLLMLLGPIEIPPGDTGLALRLSL